MTDVNLAHNYGLVKERAVPEADRDALAAYLQKVCEAGVAKDCMERKIFNTNELMNHALGQAVYNRLPQDIRDDIAQLREGKGKPVLVLRGLFPRPSSAPSPVPETNNPTDMLMRGLHSMLFADYSPEGTQGDYCPAVTIPVMKRGLDKYHIDAGYPRAGKEKTEIVTVQPFSLLLCERDVPGVPTVFVPLSEAGRYGQSTQAYADNPGDPAMLAAGDAVLFDNRRVLHARHDLNKDERLRSFISNDINEVDKTLGFRSGNYHVDRNGRTDPDGRRFIERFAEHTLVNKEGAQELDKLLAEAQKSKQPQTMVR